MHACTLPAKHTALTGTAYMDLPGETPVRVETYPCRICERQFGRESLPRHEQVCQRNAKAGRKIFDSGKQRADGTDITISAIRKVQKEITQNDGVFEPPKTHWRERHEHFQSAVKASKSVDIALKTGSPLPPPPPSVVPSDYVQCEYCGRNFNVTAAERHMPFCREQKARADQRNGVAPARRAQPGTQKVRRRKASEERFERRGTSHSLDEPRGVVGGGAKPRPIRSGSPFKNGSLQRRKPPPSEADMLAIDVPAKGQKKTRSRRGPPSEASSRGSINRRMGRMNIGY